MKAVFAIACFSIVAGWSSTAAAFVQFCNQYPQTVYFSVAYQQFDDKRQPIGWLSRGWVRVDTGKCGYLDTELSPSALYWRAETNFYKDGKRNKRDAWPPESEFFFWTHEDQFQYYKANDKSNKPAPQANFQKFARISVDSDQKANYTVTVLSDGRTFSQYTAQ